MLARGQRVAVVGGHTPELLPIHPDIRPGPSHHEMEGAGGRAGLLGRGLRWSGGRLDGGNGSGHGRGADAGAFFLAGTDAVAPRRTDAAARGREPGSAQARERRLTLADRLPGEEGGLSRAEPRPCLAAPRVMTTPTPNTRLRTPPATALHLQSEPRWGGAARGSAWGPAWPAEAAGSPWEAERVARPMVARGR